jgi:hypothetical protein
MLSLAVTSLLLISCFAIVLPKAKAQSGNWVTVSSDTLVCDPTGLTGNYTGSQIRPLETYVNPLNNYTVQYLIYSTSLQGDEMNLVGSDNTDNNFLTLYFNNESGFNAISFIDTANLPITTDNSNLTISYDGSAVYSGFINDNHVIQDVGSIPALYTLSLNGLDNGVFTGTFKIIVSTYIITPEPTPEPTLYQLISNKTLNDLMDAVILGGIVLVLLFIAVQVMKRKGF